MSQIVPGTRATELVRRLWQYCNVLRDDGLSYPDYVEQLTYLLFLKMSDEQEYGPVPSNYGWSSLAGLHARAMHDQYTRILSLLGAQTGMLGLIFRHARNKIRDPAKLRLLIEELIDKTEWTGLGLDIKGAAYEGLLEKNARDTKSGAGQYFTPRPLIDAMVKCVDPQLDEVICDPACGTGGFLLAAHSHIMRCTDLTPQQTMNLATKCLRGVELVEEVARLATMNLVLHGIGGGSDDELPIAQRDSLRTPPERLFDVILTNPPFGTRGSVTYARERRPDAGEDALTVVRRDFWVQTANKQLNFLQHVVASLKPGGRAAVVIPDNVLYETGAASTVRRRILESCDVRAILRLPSGLFYAQGIKSNVLFLHKALGSQAIPASADIRVYDLRLHKRFSLKTNPIKDDDLSEFVGLYRSGFRPTSLGESQLEVRLRTFRAREILSTSDCRLDLTWGPHFTPESNSGLHRIEEISQLVADDLQRALASIENIRRHG